MQKPSTEMASGSSVLVYKNKSSGVIIPTGEAMSRVSEAGGGSEKIVPEGNPVI
jgi:hypothetical protein